MNPFIGLYPYQEEDKKMFYGRDDETANLFQLIKFNLLTVVLGKSGIGKTSLLNAGVIPLLKDEEFLPIRLRLDYSKEALSLKQQICQTIRDELKDREIKIKIQGKDEPAAPLQQDETLWQYFHRVKHFAPPTEENEEEEEVMGVLVFDQFEEFFTLGKEYSDEDKDDLLDELSWLIEGQFPAPLKKEILKRGKGYKKKRGFPLFSGAPDIRVIISIREDYLPHLTDLKSRIPSIDRVMFRVINLNGIEAREIVNMPGGIEDENVTGALLRLFYPDDAKETKEIPDKNLEVEPSILSLVCFQIIEKGMTEEFTPKDREKILTDFYETAIKGVSKKVEEFIEDRLLNERGFRTLLRLEHDHPLKKPLRQLVKRRILRPVHLGGREYIEIIHDVLGPIIKEKKNKRLDKISKRELEKRIRKTLFRQIGAIVLLAFIISFVFAVYQKNQAEKQYINAEVNRMTVEALLEFPQDSTRAIILAGEAFEKAKSNPPPRTVKTLSDIGYSSIEEPFYTTILHHKEAINTAVFSPGGKQILTASDDGTAKLWDFKGRQLLDLNEHEGPVSSAVFSRDGKRILTASRDGTAVIWSLEGKPLKTFNNKGDLTFAEFSPDGRRIVTASWDEKATVWDMEGNPLLRLSHTSVVASAVFSPDGNYILTASWDKSVRLWDMAGNELLPLMHDDGLDSAVFSPGGNRILTACANGISILWDRNGNQIKTFEHNAGVSSADFILTPDGERILTSSRDETAVIWDLDGNPVKKLTDNGALYFASFAPGDGKVITASRKGIAKVWQLESGIVTTLNNHTQAVNIAVFSPDNSRVLTASRDGTAKIWDLEGNLLDYSITHSKMINAAVFSPDGSRVLTASWDKTAQILNLEEKSRLTLPHGSGVSSAVFSPNGRRILTASHNGVAKMWTREGTLIQKFIHGDSLVYRAEFSPLGNWILTASTDGSAKLWSSDGTFLKELKHDKAVISAVFSPNNRMVLTASNDETAKLWDLGGETLATFDAHKDVLVSAVFAPKGKKILTASRDGTAILWSLEGKKLKQFRHAKALFSAVFSHDGKRILTASRDGTARLWDLDGNLLVDCNKHRGLIFSAVLSKDGSRILTASRDKTAKIWLTPKAVYQWTKTLNLQNHLDRQGENGKRP
ncbi:MAG: hypothetical protein GY950_21970 [bacterium]|nr:hypothetical protein [bacterium]